jgi:hypothetical protein
MRPLVVLAAISINISNIRISNIIILIRGSILHIRGIATVPMNSHSIDNSFFARAGTVSNLLSAMAAASCRVVTGTSHPVAASA